MSGRPRVPHQIIDGVEHKQCFRCKEWKPSEEFGNHKQSWDRLRAICRKCDSEKGRKYYSENKEQKNKKNRLYRKANKEQVRAQDRKYYRKKHGPKIEKRILHKVIEGNEYKRCSTCKGWFPIQFFYKKKREWDGLDCACKKCNAITQLKYYANNKKAILARTKKWELAHPESLRARAKRSMAKILSTAKGRLRYRISNSMGAALRGNKAGRHWEDLVPYNLDQLYRRLRRTLPKGYVWQDYLDGKLHVDHKIPVSVFNFEKPEDDDFQRCFALKNLQLLPVRENIIKSNKLDRHFQPSLKF